MEGLQGLACWIAEHLAELGNFVLAAVVAWTALEGRKINRRLAEAELDPFITITIEQQRSYPSFFDLVIKNAGRGPARRVVFDVDPDTPIWGNDNRRLTDIAFVKRGLDYLAPGQD